MTINQTDQNLAQLRQKAVAKLAYAPDTKQITPSSEKLLHELRVHQVELEMQNEQLRDSQIALEKSRDRYVDFHDFAPVGYLALNRQGLIDEINLTGAALLGVERNKLPHHRFVSYIVSEDRDRWHRHFIGVMKCDDTRTCELELQHGDGPHIYARLDCLRLKKDGKELVVRVVLTDITERKQAEAKALQMAQFLNALSRCNEVITRCTTEEELFTKICGIVVQISDIKMAWVGLVDGADKQVNTVASCGTGMEYLAGIRILMNADSPFGRGPTATSIREDKPLWCQDFMNDPIAAPWHERGAHFGWRSSAALPLHKEGVAIGAITLYSAVVNAFDEAIRNLLVELVSDISFALDNFARDDARKLAEDALNLFKHTLDQTLDCIFMFRDDNFKFIYVNEGAINQVGYTRAELLEMTPLDIKPEFTLERFLEMVQPLCNGTQPSINVQTVNRHKDGHDIPVEIFLQLVRNEGSAPRYMAVVRDVTERKIAEAEILRNNIELENLNSTMSSDLLVAQDVMSYILRSGGLRDKQIRHFQRPALQFSGDIIAVRRDNNGDLRIMLADATGHGLQAALFLLPIFRVFRAMVMKGLPTSYIVTEMNQTMRGIAKTGRFIAAAVAHITRDGSSIEIWNGGIPSVFHVQKNGELHKFRSIHPPLGVVGANSFEAITEIFHAPPGALILCSDGLTEAESASGEFFGEARFESILRTSPPDELFDNILSALKTHLGEGVAHDDISMVLAQGGD